MSYVETLKRVTPKGIHSHLGKVRRWLRTIPARTARQKQRLLDDHRLTDTERDLLKQVEPGISTGDGMYIGDGEHYFRVGLSAIRCIDEAIAAARLGPVRRVLDLPCGHGRVLRFLAHRFPQAEIVASDLDRKGVDFCVKALGSRGIYSEPNPKDFFAGGEFDLIWCGSLVTHLNAEGIRGLLACFVRELKPKGLLIVTTHGDRVVQRMLAQDFDYAIESTAPLINAYRRDGFGFTDYPGARDYGVSLTSTEWIRRQAADLDLQEVYFRARGWDDHQDVYGFQLASSPNARD
jgi:SAM-dependent methyltransferase